MYAGSRSPSQLRSTSGPGPEVCSAGTVYATIRGVPGLSSRTTAAACPTSGWEANAVSISPSSMRSPRILTWSSVRPR